MGCLYGSQPQSGKEVNQEIDISVGLNPAARLVLTTAFYPLVHSINLFSFCSLDAPAIRDISVSDYLDPQLLGDKVRDNALALAWFQNCECNAQPAPPEPPEDPIEIPPEDPNTVPSIPDPPNCNNPSYTGRNWLIWRVRDYYYQYSWYRMELDRMPDGFSNTVQNDVLLFYVYFGNQQVLYHQSTTYPAVGTRLLLCGEFPEDPEPPEEPPVNEDPCVLFGCCSDESEDGDCLKQPDKADIISTINLHTSESNNRIRDELLAELSAMKLAIFADIASSKASLDALIRSQHLTDREQAIQDLQSIRDEINATEQTLQGWIDGAKNQILLTLGGSITALGAAIAASFVALSTALATAQAALAAAIAAARASIISRVDDSTRDIELAVKRAGELNNPIRKVVRVTVLTKPANTVITAGRNGAPDRYSAGWVQFYTQIGSNPKRYGVRQFIINDNSAFYSETPEEYTSYDVHTLVGFTYSITSDKVRFQSEVSE